MAGVEYPLSKNVYVAAFGKAVVGMIRALEDLLGDHIVDGVASVRYGIIDALKDNGRSSENRSRIDCSQLIPNSAQVCATLPNSAKLFPNLP